ncbi:hypothetical protein, partial [Escherichia coli]|uniref:hypothetical protein n=1 Tax=Escherichia coli TaxID=562 RepID=UPI00197AD757
NKAIFKGFVCQGKPFSRLKFEGHFLTNILWAIDDWKDQISNAKLRYTDCFINGNDIKYSRR